MSNKGIFLLRGVHKVWMASGSKFQLVVPELNIEPGQKLAVQGQSGCGKSTLLDMLAMALAPSNSKCFQFKPEPGQPIDIGEAWKHKQYEILAALRAQYIGYVLQTGGLLPFLTVRENIELPRNMLGMPYDKTLDLFVERLGLTTHLKKLPAALSVGERQRVAIGRALAHNPPIVLADEPTGSLDPITAGQVMELLIELADKLHTTLIVASHDWNLIKAHGLPIVNHELRQKNNETHAEFWL